MSPPVTSNQSWWLSTRVLVAFLSLLGTAIMYITRVNLNIAILSMTKKEMIVELIGETNRTVTTVVGDFDWGPSEQGIILGSFFYGYIITQVIGGRLAESYFSPTGLIFVSLSASGLINLITPFVARFSMPIFITSRVLLGAFQGIVYPALYCILQKWIPPNERGTFYAWLDAGITFGMVLTSATSGQIIVWFSAIGGWPMVFYVSGLVALLWSLVWILLVRSDPKDHPFIKKEELNMILESQDIEGTIGEFTPCWKRILLSKGFYAIIFAKVFYGIVFDLVTLKIPAYFQDVLHKPVDWTGYAFAFVMTGYMITLFSGGVLADLTLTHTNLSKLNVRKLFQTVSGVIMTISLLALPYCDSTNVWSNIAWLSCCMLGYGFTSGGDVPITADISGPLSGTVFAIVNTLCSISGFVVPYIVGVIIETEPGLKYSWDLIFYGNAVLTIIGTIGFMLLATADLRTDWYDEVLEAKLLPTNIAHTAFHQVQSNENASLQNKKVSKDPLYNTFSI